ncbi:hypothetical protein DY000_02059023 [Brassica cretica]|uniref:Uncharacterized protein n=1 Tax=Brassica cretica TaxID=69181 RepID=A0ABQ7B2R8_BRACR|nr:hypothetical protein DY000_02059023 [Brassica cretica]
MVREFDSTSLRGRTATLVAKGADGGDFSTEEGASPSREDFSSSPTERSGSRLTRR